jgi:simple sugar transport system ATP-binding protein
LSKETKDINKKPLVQVKNIGKSFGATRALDNVSFDFYPGEIFAMVGANGAGKSTLIKIICGYYSDYEGDVIVDGKKVIFSSPQDAYKQGIQTVHQIINQGVIQTMTVAENLALADMLSPEQSLIYKPKKIKERALEIAESMDLTHLDMDTEVEDISQSDRQMIAIARAVAANPKLLILDEPTSSISERESERLFEILFKLKNSGVSILYVSHRLHEIEKIADKVGVIRDGIASALLTKPFKVQEIVKAMVGDVISHQRKSINRNGNSQKPKIELKELVVQENTPPINLKLFAGEIVGITGLIGAGKSELAQVLFGMREPVSGEILLDGNLISSKNISEAIENGIFMVPEDRNNNAIIPETSIRRNITLPFLDFFSKLGIMNQAKEKSEAERMVKAMNVKCSDENALIESLSGGNQQKVIVARWLMKNFNLLILDEPFQGVDISSRREISQYLSENSDGKAILVLAADIDEILEVADRIIVLNHGRIVGEQLYEDHNKDELVHLVSKSIDEISQEVR